MRLYLRGCYARSLARGSKIARRLKKKVGAAALSFEDLTGTKGVVVAVSF